MNMTDRILPVVACVLIVLGGLILPAFAKEKYQTYTHQSCDCCGKEKSIFTSLEVHHFFVQHLYIEWKDVEANTCTLCRRCHLVFHRGNFKKCCPEFCTVFGKTVEGIRVQCIKETGVMK
jgi:hypothetical protein